MGEAQTLAYTYKVDKDGQEKIFHLFSEWKNDAVFSKLVRLALPEPPFTLTVTPEDIWGNIGTPLTAHIDTIPSQVQISDRLPEAVPRVTEGPLSGISITYDNITVTGDSPQIDMFLASDCVPERYDDGHNALIRYDLSEGKITCHPFKSGITVVRHPALQHENASRVTLRFY